MENLEIQTLSFKCTEQEAKDFLFVFGKIQENITDLNKINITSINKGFNGDDFVKNQITVTIQYILNARR